MFGRNIKHTIMGVLKELYAELANVEGKIEAEKADLIRARVNVEHHEAQIRFLNSRIVSVDAAIKSTEKTIYERKESEAAAASASGSGRRYRFWRAGNRVDKNGEDSQQEGGLNLHAAN